MSAPAIQVLSGPDPRARAHQPGLRRRQNNHVGMVIAMMGGRDVRREPTIEAAKAAISSPCSKAPRCRAPRRHYHTPRPRPFVDEVNEASLLIQMRRLRTKNATSSSVPSSTRASTDAEGHGHRDRLRLRRGAQPVSPPPTPVYLQHYTAHLKERSRCRYRRWRLVASRLPETVAGSGSG